MSTVDERLAAERNIWLATTRPDGRPHLAPVWFVAVDGRIWVGTGAGSVRVANLATNPAVALSLEDGNEPVVAEGVGTVHPTERPAAVAAAFRDKYGWDITLPDDPDVGTVVLIEIAVRKWLFGIELPTAPSD